MTRRQALMPRRRPVKERIEEWYKPPWRRSGDGDDASMILARWSKKAFSGVKRKRNAEYSAPNKERSYEQWTCALCDLNTSCEVSFKEHCAGQRHMSNVVDLDWTKETAGFKKIATADIYHGIRHNLWSCSICQVKSSSELDLKNHQKGRRHQENVEALQGEHKEIEGSSGLPEAESYEKEVPQLANKEKGHASRWNCSICKANCTSESDLDSHRRGRRHQRNVKAQLVGNNITVLDSLVDGKKQQEVAALGASN